MMRFLALAVAIAPMPVSAALPDDELASPMWAFVAGQVFGEGAVVRFDPRVRVRIPTIAENQRVFPVEVDAREIAGVRRMVIVADLNPIQLALDYRPADAAAFVATRIKLDQRTPVRGAVQLDDGTWLVSGGWIDAAGGGCSAPPVSRVKGDWAARLGEVRGGLWRHGDAARLQLSFRHPMDTGFVDNIASYYIEELVLTGSGGRPLGRVRLQASVAEDPVVTLEPRVRAGEAVHFDGRDTNGIEYRGDVRAGT
jgi:sulfur-oxidizing protein SoxY